MLLSFGRTSLHDELSRKHHQPFQGGRIPSSLIRSTLLGSVPQPSSVGFVGAGGRGLAVGSEARTQQHTLT